MKSEKKVCLSQNHSLCFQKQGCFLLGYSECYQCYRIYKIETLIVDESKMSGLMINLFLMKQSCLRISADTVSSCQKLQNKEVNLQKLCTSEVMDQKIIRMYVNTLQKECFLKRS